MASLPTEQEKPDALVGRVLVDRFELQALAGAGGMGRVYRARDREGGATVAVKVLPGDGDVARFAREAELLAAMDHPGIVRHVAHGTTPEAWQYIAMEWLTGEDLAARLEQRKLSIDETVLLATRVAEALSAAHERGIVHRDLKPANLFLVDGQLEAVKLLDFGIARMMDGGELTVSGTVMGTPQYMSPEQVRGTHVDARADVYGLGAVLFRCLAGYPPFSGSHQVAVLAKIVLEPAPRLRTVVPDAPAALESLIDRMLAKEPEDRPADCRALLDSLRVVGGPPPSSERHVPAAVTASERRVASVVLCARSADDETTLPETQHSVSEDALVRTIRERGGVIDALARGAWVVTIPETASPADQALRAVRCALALGATRPGSPVYVATGRVVVDGGQTMGEVIDRAADALVESASVGAAGVWMDAATAQLVEGRFLVEHDESWSRLVEEVDVVAPVRMLLGKPTPCVGRQPQVAMLTTMLASVAEQRRACAVVVTASAGLGKTHLVHEFLRTGIASAPDLDLLVGRGDVARAGSPLGLVARLLERTAGIREADPEPARARKLAALATRDLPGPELAHARETIEEICGIHPAGGEGSPALRAARADPSLMADAVREAWSAWIRARAARGPVLLLVEDAHWGDAPSMALVEQAFLAHAEEPLFLLATARPGTVSWEKLRASGLVEIALAPLSVAACEGLVRGALGAEISDEVVSRIARRAAGHPFHLEELIRAVASGRGSDELPDSVLGMVQARFAGLDTRARRVLRAASVFGETFWSGGVASLMGDEFQASEVGAVLRALADGELVTRQRSSRWPNEVEHRFRHSLLREGAYASLPDADRVRAHRRAAAWLEETGEKDPAVLAEHFDRGDAPERAIEFLRRAAEQALHRHDLERARTHAARALALGAHGLVEAELHAIESEVHYWRGDLAPAAERARAAAERLPRGSRAWFDAVSVAIGALGQLGRNAEVAAHLQDVAAVASAPTERGAQVVALARGLAQLFWAHHGAGLPEVRAQLDALAQGAGSLDPFPQAWVHRVRGESAWLHDRDAGRCLTELALSCEHFERAHASRAACLTRLNMATLLGWSGAPDEALGLAVRSREEAARIGADFLLRYAAAVEGVILTYARRPEAAAAMRDALTKVAGSPRLSFLVQVISGSLALERGDLDEAQARAEAARGLTVASELRPAGVGLLAQVLGARGRAAEAAALVEDAAQMEQGCHDLELTWGLAGLALAQARASTDEQAARAALDPVVARLDAVASTLPTAAQRARFWQRPLPNAEIAQLARRLGLALPSAGAP